MEDIDKELMEATGLLKKSLELNLMSNGSEAAQDTCSDDPYCEALVSSFSVTR